MNNVPETTISQLNDCGCCEGVTVKTPIEIDNRQSLQVLAYRIGEHADFKASMLAQLSSTKFSGLKGLRTRNDNDFSIALLDAWSMVADVLTFYDQYYANECYLRTATERLSILELARLIGYRPHPGVAASTLLVFMMDDIAGSPEKIKLSVGTKVQSTPKQDEQAQIFETTEEIEARPEWNSIKPKLTKPQILATSSRKIVLEGINTGLAPGNAVLFRVSDASGAGGRNVLATVTKVELNHENSSTNLLIEPVSSAAIHGGDYESTSSTKEASLSFPGNLINKTYSAAELEAETQTSHFKIHNLFDTLTINAPMKDSVVVFRQHASIFGHNAPDWNSLPESLTGSIPVYKKSEHWDNYFIGGMKSAPFSLDELIWPGGDDGHIDKLISIKCPTGKPRAPLGLKDNSPDGGGSEESKADNQPSYWLFLDNTYKEIKSSTQIVLKDERTWGLYEIKDVNELTKSCFTITSKVTRLNLDSSAKFDEFSIRGTSVYLQSESISLANIPNTDSIPVNHSQSLELNGFVAGLHEGQKVVLSGLTVGGDDKLVSEFLTLDEVKHKLMQGESTHITFSPALKNIYKRESVIINANVARATHGETAQEVLGSGDATQPYQTFKLKQLPLTHISASTHSGAESTLAVRVNDVLWRETNSLLKHQPDDRVFITRNNDASETIIKFGNGVEGARLPTGESNVRATYRKGIGAEGLVDAGQLNMLMSRPLGLKEATNPFASMGAANPESHDHAQRNAPFTVMTLDRAVSLRDYEDFSRTFAGVAKALAIATPSSQGKAVFITIAGPNGAQIQQDSKVYENLLGALTGAGDPLARFRVKSYRPVTFRFSGKVKVEPDFITENVLDEVDAALRAAFSFDKRAFGQPVALSEVIAVIQAIPGIVAVDVDFLYRGNIQKAASIIPAQPPVINTNGQMQAAELLTLHPGPLDLLGVMA